MKENNDAEVIADLYALHVIERQKKTEVALHELGYDALVLSSGKSFTYFMDDTEAPFRTNPHFAHWLPYQGPQHLLYIAKGEMPKLIAVVPEDFWQEHISPEGAFWSSHFSIETTRDTESAWKRVNLKNHIAYIGDSKSADTRDIPEKDINPPDLLSRLEWERAYKTDYEIFCMEEAQKIAGRGHRAAKETFLEGGSELEIHHAYLAAAGLTEKDLPYENIVALNEKAAILHYQGKRNVGNGDVLLIDAGAKYNGYAADITRTYVRENVDPLFKTLLRDMEKIQQELCAEVMPGVAYAEIHRSAHRKIAKLLCETEILFGTPEELRKKEFTKVFFPHGIGHFLGLQVHDVGGHLENREGRGAAAHADSPTLRTTRTLEERHVVTIEPGLYFIEILLRPHRVGATSKFFNWQLIDRLKGYGGIRIEDDILVTKDGNRNLTREQGTI